MAHAGMIKGMPTSFSRKSPVCDHCILGKQTRTLVPKKREKGDEHRAVRKLEKVWVDLAGQTAIISWTGNNYVMNIVDDYTDKSWLILLKSKDNAFNELKTWILACKNETSLKLKILRTGQDSELNGNKHKDWYREREILLEVRALYILAHIKRIEQMHQILMGKA